MSEDLIRRMDAIQACQVGPPDEWSPRTKGGYNLAATDCAMNILKIPTADLCAAAQSRVDQESPDPLGDPRVKALVEALDQLLPRNLGPASCLTDSAVIPVDMTMGEIRKARAALTAMKGGE